MADSRQGTPKSASSQAQILLSSALIGGSSALNMAVGVLRTKIMALMLAPAGFGLMGVFITLVDLGRTLSAMGVYSSGVRQIAEAAAAQDDERISRTVWVVRRTTFALGVVGAVLFAFSSPGIASFTFKNAEHATSVAILSLAVLLRVVADGQGALLQGLRRIADIAKVGVYGAVLGAVASVLLVYWFGERGVAPSIVAVAAASLLPSWWYSRSIRVKRVAFDLALARREAAPLLRLGAAFMASSVFTMAAAYAVRMILIREDGLEAAGLYQSAWAIAGIYVAFVLQAMGVDFYPRLVATASDNATCCRLVNEQTQVSLLIASTGVIATLTFAPLVIAVLYTSAFNAAADVLRWVCLGMALRVITWPLGYIMIAKGRSSLFMLTDLAWAIFNVVSTWVGIHFFGLAGAGIAFFCSYLFHVLLVYPISRRLCGFAWSRANLRTGAAFVVLIGLVHTGFQISSGMGPLLLGFAATALSAAYAWFMLRQTLSEIPMSAGLSRFLQKRS